MAKTVIVGKVSIRVWPDTRLFRKALEADVAKAVAGVDGEVEVEPKVSDTALRVSLLEAIRKANLLAKNNPAYRFTIYADVEMSRLKQKLTQALSNLGSQTLTIPSIQMAPPANAASQKAALFKQFKNMPPITIPGKIKPAIQITDLNREVGKARAAMQAVLGKVVVSLKTDLDPRESFRQVAKIQAKLKTKAIELKTKFDTSKAMTQLRAMTAKAKALELKVKPKLDNVATRWVKAELKQLFNKAETVVKPTLSKEGVVAVRAKLAAAFRKTTVTVQAVLDNKSVAKVGTALSALSGGRMVSQLFNYKQLANLDKMVPKIALIATSIGQIAAAALTAAGNMLSLGRSIAEMAPAALALPGIFAGLATMAVATGVALKDITKQIPALNGSMSKMAAGLRVAFWDNAQKPMESLVRTWLPMFDTGMKKVGGGMGAFFGNLSRDLDKVVSNRLPSWFDATAKASNNLASGSGGIAAIVKNLGDLGARILPRMTQSMADIANKFGAWLDAKAATGELNAAVETGIQRMKEFGSAIGGAWSILDALSKAAQDAGGSTLKSLATNLNKIGASLKTVQAQTHIRAVFEAAGQAMDEMWRRGGAGVLKLFESLGTLIPKLLPAIGAVAGELVNMVSSALSQPEVGAGLMDFFVSLKSALITIGPAFDSVGKGIGGLASLLGVFLTSVAPLVNVALGSLQSHTEGFLDALKGLIPQLASGLLGVVNALLPAIGRIAPVVNSLITQLGSAIAKIAQDAAPGIAAVGDGLATAFEMLGQAVAPVISMLANNLGPILAAMGQWFGGVIRLVGSVASALIGLAMSILNWLIPPFRDVAQKWGPTLSAQLTKLGEAFTKLVAPITAVCNLLGPVLQPIFQWLFNFIAGSIGGAIQGLTMIVNGLGQAFTWLANVLGVQVPTAMNNAQTWTQVASTGISSSLSGLNGTAAGVGTAFGGMATTVETRLSQLNQQAGILTGQAKAQVIAQMAQMRAGTLAEMGAMATGTDAKLIAMATKSNAKMGELANKIPSMTGKSKQQALAQLDEMRAAYDQKFSGLSSMVATKTADIPAKITENSGGISHALVKPVKSGMSGIKAEMNKIGSIVRGVVNSAKGSLSASGRSIIGSVAQGIRDNTGSAVAAARDAMSAIRRVFPSSPAKDPQSAFHGRGWTLYSGRAIATSIGDGIYDEIAYARRASEELAQVTALPLSSSKLGRVNAAAIQSQIAVMDGSEAPLSIGSLSIGPDDPEYQELIEFARTLRRKVRQRGVSS